MPHKQLIYKDKRLLVLIAFGACLYAINVFGFGINRLNTNTAYDLVLVTSRVDPKSTSGSIISFKKHSYQPDCREIDPRLSLFLNLPMPINQANRENLMMLPGVGPKKAERILNLRNRLGRITGIEELMQVKGIGPKMSRKIASLLCFD